MEDIFTTLIESLVKESPYALTTIAFMYLVWKMYKKSVEKIEEAYKGAMRELRRTYTGKKGK